MPKFSVAAKADMCRDTLIEQYDSHLSTQSHIQEMFCPKCNAVLVQHADELKCVPGDMALSKNLEQALTERYKSHAPLKQFDSATGPMRAWYCPGCGVSLDDELVCPHCQISLSDLQQTLVELHPHC
jgi:Zn-finger nucleic acid-binding protein